MRIPFIVYDGFCDHVERIYNITIDNYDGGLQVGKYFLENGHKKALCISDNEICMDKERYDGFCAGFGKENVEFLLIPMSKKERKEFYMENLENIRSCSAIFAVSDYYAVDMIHFLREQGISVPEDISVAGFDDTPVCRRVSPKLTSVRQDTKLRAQIAIEKLKDLREKKEMETTIRLPVTLIERESTGAYKA